ncbi:hypothetical protein DFH06DRAFT_1289905 [Mycena polygramma]|nr:hypothetical protein DFH06DRAFT_1289905 [Mycena polygramma]
MPSATTTTFASAHRQYVQSLYKRRLKNSLDWTIRRDVWRGKAMEIRAEFERNRDVKDPRQLAQILEQAEAKLAAWKHPDPYIPPTAPGGTKWERNLPVPSFIHISLACPLTGSDSLRWRILMRTMSRHNSSPSAARGTRSVEQPRNKSALHTITVYYCSTVANPTPFFHEDRVCKDSTGKPFTTGQGREA